MLLGVGPPGHPAGYSIRRKSEFFRLMWLKDALVS